MRLAFVINLAPRMVGSFEDWIAAVCATARERGHWVDVYGRNPAHPVFLKRLSSLGAGWATADSLLASTYRGIRRLASYQAIHLDLFPPHSRMALMALAAVPAKVLFVDHASSTGARPEGRIASAMRRALGSAAMLRVAGIAGVSNYVAERNRRRFPHEASRVRTLYGGVDLERFLSPPPRLNGDADRRALRVLTVGHLLPEKGVEFLVRGVALAKNRELQLVICGDGPEMGNLQALAARLGIRDRVEFTGLRDDVPEFLEDCDVFVHPAIWQEAFGLAIAEAMASARPVIATRVGGVPELVEHRQTGLLVEPQNAQQIADALDLLSDHPELRRALGAGGRVRATERFNLTSCALAHVTWCEEAAGIRRRGRLPSMGHAAHRPA